MSLHAKVNGSWRQVAIPYVKVSNNWRVCADIFVKVHGVVAASSNSKGVKIWELRSGEQN